MKIRSKTSLQRAVATLVVACAALAGCATTPRPIRTEVTSFNDWSALPTTRTYTFSRTLEFRDSLEVQSYEDIVRGELASQGFRLAADGAQADLVVTLRPSMSWTSVRIRDPWPVDPWWGPYGGFYGPRGWYGGFYGAGYYGGGFYGGAAFDNYTVDVYKARLELDIDSRAVAGKRYYEGRVESSGRLATLPAAMPVLVRALFTDFPGNNGQTRRVDVPVVRVDRPRGELQ